MKRPRGQSLAAAMGRLLALRRREQLAALRPDLVVPIPMYWLRRTLRGINSPEILGECLARHLGIRRVRPVLIRRRNTLPQMDLPPRKRFRNIRAAFALRRGCDLQGARVLLVDDVLTTGATCSVAAEVLKQAGAEMVAAAVLARAEGPDSR